MITREESAESAGEQSRKVAYAARFVAAAAPLRFGQAETAAEQEAIYRLRAAVAIESGWARPDAFSDGRERDSDDDRSVLLGGWEGPVLAAACRLVLPQPGRPLPVEADFGITIEPQGKVVEVGRLCLAPAYRGARYRFLKGLMGQVGLEATAGGFTHAAGAVSAGMARIHRQLEREGLRIVILGAPRHLGDERRYPARFEW